MNIVVPLGTRPEIIKLAPVIAELRRRGHEVTVVATGQHHDHALAGAFFDALEVQPDVVWELAGDEAARTASIYEQAHRLLGELLPELVLVLGDTNTVPLFGLAARRWQVPVAHLEAGMRSFNERSLEESNRRTVAALASLHLVPTALAARFLSEEGVREERVHVVGNPITDVLLQSGIPRIGANERRGVLFTAHRATNVDDPERLAAIVEIVRRLAKDLGPVVFPVHPRTRKRLEEAGFAAELAGTPRLQLLEPVPWHDLLELLRWSRVVVTDSGGMQEEASWFGVPAVVLRLSTPRWEGVRAGTSALVGLEVEAAVAAAVDYAGGDAQRRAMTTPCLYGDGTTSTQVADLLDDPDVRGLLTLREPDLVATSW